MARLEEKRREHGLKRVMRCRSYVRYLYRLGACFVVCVRVSVVSVCCLREGFRMADDAVQGAGRSVMDEDAAQPLSGVAAVDSQESRNYTRTAGRKDPLLTVVLLYSR